jgi:mRNA-degrading endonuclease RelE of RelBE toxin-antitoxin system
MPWRVDLSRRGARDFTRLSPEQQRAVTLALGRLIDNPASVDFAELGGTQDRWRLRVGRWRIILDGDNRAGLMTVARIHDRRDAYRD